MEYIVAKESRGTDYHIMSATACIVTFLRESERIMVVCLATGMVINVSPTDQGSLHVFDSFSKALAHVNARKEQAHDPNE
jgi:hypothetical protein